MLVYAFGGGSAVPDKRCRHCSEVKPPEEFYRLRSAPDGLQTWCKDCQRARKRNPESVRQHTAKWKAANVAKRRAHRKVFKAVKRGRLIRAVVCERCGDEELTHAHHEDYSKPLVVVWLCRGCHVAEHRREAASAA